MQGTLRFGIPRSETELTIMSAGKVMDTRTTPGEDLQQPSRPETKTHSLRRWRTDEYARARPLNNRKIRRYWR